MHKLEIVVKMISTSMHDLKRLTCAFSCMLFSNMCKLIIDKTMTYCYNESRKARMRGCTGKMPVLTLFFEDRL